MWVVAFSASTRRGGVLHPKAKAAAVAAARRLLTGSTTCSPSPASQSAVAAASLQAPRRRTAAGDSAGLAGGFTEGGCLRRQWRSSAAVAAAPSPASPSEGGASTSAPSASGSSGSSKESPDASKQKKDEEEKPYGWTSFLIRAAGGVSGLFVAWHFYQAGYNVHRTEVRVVEALRKLPFYWPAGLPMGFRNSKLDPEGLPPDFVAEFAQWFLASDLLQPEGVTRDDILELVSELGFDEMDKVCKDFLFRGEGELEERKRLTGCGLQESITLLAKLSKPDTGKDAKHRPPVGDEMTEILRRKRSPLASVLGGAMALQQQQSRAVVAAPLAGAVGNQASPGEAAAPAAISPAMSPFGGVAAPAFGTEEESEGVDEAEMQLLEDARLARIEAELVARLERLGSLSPAEEARLRDVRSRRSSGF
eukprot:TRINITY_DN93144_c0_g1_i1.p1 TRINITY_DN93144_c0_g1~~TRINITY_DN93144_c0_g1_i1.p1  ORF type:complete len:421 (-),score=126.95 TRINITY_DN93144_c0_g1_i1:142-1404(-)